jgi:hypothetical protein
MWHTLKAVGFAYFEEYSDSKSLTVAWISRTKEGTRYTAFYCNGKEKFSTTRGSMKNARDFIAGLIAKYGYVR